MIPFVNVFFSVQLGATTDDIGIIFAIGAGAMVISSILGPVVGRRVAASTDPAGAVTGTIPAAAATS